MPCLSSSSPLNITFPKTLFLSTRCRKINGKATGLGRLRSVAGMLSVTTPPTGTSSIQCHDSATKSYSSREKQIKGLSAKKCVYEILDIINKEVGDWTVLDFNDLLLALVAQNQPDLAFKLYSHLFKHGFVPDSSTSSIMIRCHSKRNDFEEAKRILDRMLKSEHHPNAATFAILIHSLCNKGRLERAFEVLETITRIGLKATIHTYNCLLKGLCYLGRVEEAYEMLMSIKKNSESSSLVPNIYSYTAVMDGFCKVGRSNEARELLIEATEIGLTPTVATYNTLFDGYCREGRPLRGFSVLRRMRKSSCDPDYITYVTLLNGLLKWGEIRTALSVFEEMEGLGFRLEDKVFNRLLRGICVKSLTETDLADHAYQLFDKTTKRRVSVLDSGTYGLLVRSLCVREKVEEALLLLDRTMKMGFIPRTITFNSVIQALCTAGKMEEALLIVVSMNEHGKIPSRTSYDVMINEFNQTERCLVACNVYGAALKQRVFPQRKPQVRRQNS